MGKWKTRSYYGPNNPRWKGGKYTASCSGYVYLLIPEHPNADKRGYVREHVLIMSDHIGRPIAKSEIVHHLNGIKNDNRKENLELLERGKHHSLHHKGLYKANSIKALRGHTSQEMYQIWNTSRAHERMKPKVCHYCGKEFYRRGKRGTYCSESCFHASRIKSIPP